ncbi:MAG: tRNA (adenosine(37)-N6)-dimethylallyltransferase MiaA [Bryobacter sp.]
MFDGEIVNADSLQIYRGMDIGTAKPGVGEREMVPHHLLDVRNPDEVFSAGDYLRMAREVVREISGRGRLPIVVGGTGFYLKAFLEGLPSGPTADVELRKGLEAREGRRPGVLHRFLRFKDRAAALRIHANDRQKVVRAIEMALLGEARKFEGEELSLPLPGFRVCLLGLNPAKEALRNQIVKRTQAMFAAGLVEEVERLRGAGYGPQAKAMESVGYRQVQEYLEGARSLESAREDTTLRTQQYAKRQMTWFRKMENVQWIEGFGGESAVQAQAESRLEQFLRGGDQKFF